MVQQESGFQALWVEDLALWRQSPLSFNQNEWGCVCVRAHTIPAAYNNKMPSEAFSIFLYQILLVMN